MTVTSHFTSIARGLRAVTSQLVSQRASESALGGGRQWP